MASYEICETLNLRKSGAYSPSPMADFYKGMQIHRHVFVHASVMQKVVTTLGRSVFYAVSVNCLKNPDA